MHSHDHEQEEDSWCFGRAELMEKPIHPSMNTVLALVDRVQSIFFHPTLRLAPQQHWEDMDMPGPF